MTPKEKAFQLFENYRVISLIYLLDKTKDIKDANNIWKQCALIAVDEILNNIDFASMLNGVDDFNYWLEVKKEIEKL